MAAVRPRILAADKVLRAQSTARRVAVLGGGITGLTTAYRLSEDPSTSVTLYEKSNKLGGWLQSERVEVDGGSVLFEWGPRTLRASGEASLPTLELLRDLGLEESMLHTPVNSPAARNRYIYYPDRLVRLPSPSRGLLDLLMQCAREPLVRDTLWALLNEPFQPYRTEQGDESVDSLLTRRFGAKVASNIASAIFHGIYAGDISRLSARTIVPFLCSRELENKSFLRSLLFPPKFLKIQDEVEYDEILAREKGQKQVTSLKHSVLGSSVMTPKDGLEDIVQRLKAKLSAAPNVEVKFNARLNMINNSRTNPSLKVDVAGLPAAEFDHVVSTIPSLELAKLLNSPRNSEDSMAKYLNSNDFAASIMVVNLYYRERDIVPVRGFGYLIPRSVPFEQNPERALGVIFSSETGVGQDTAPGTKLTVMLGGPYWVGQRAADMPDEQSSIEMAKSLLRRHLHITAEPAAAKARFQRDAIPQYQVNHPLLMQHLHRDLDLHYGSRLQVAGAWYTGVSVNDCIRSGRLSAASILAGTPGWTGLERFRE